MARAIKAESRSGESATADTDSLTNLALFNWNQDTNPDYSLATELAQLFLRQPELLMNGLVGLDQVWCGWNRARGIGE